MLTAGLHVHPWVSVEGYNCHRVTRPLFEWHVYDKGYNYHRVTRPLFEWHVYDQGYNYHRVTRPLFEWHMIQPTTFMSGKHMQHSSVHYAKVAHTPLHLLSPYAPIWGLREACTSVLILLVLHLRHVTVITNPDPNPNPNPNSASEAPHSNNQYLFNNSFTH